MFRLTLLQLLVFIISIMCLNTSMGQTFQYSRGWTNGKRSQGLANILNQQQAKQRYLQKEENDISSDFYDDHLLERCLIQMPRYMRTLLGRTSLYSGALSLRPTPANTNSNNNVDNNNKNNNLFGNHHQSNELFDELNGAIETSDYGKH